MYYFLGKCHWDFDRDCTNAVYCTSSWIQDIFSHLCPPFLLTVSLIFSVYWSLSAFVSYFYLPSYILFLNILKVLSFSRSVDALLGPPGHSGIRAFGGNVHHRKAFRKFYLIVILWLLCGEVLYLLALFYTFLFSTCIFSLEKKYLFKSVIFWSHFCWIV